MCKAGVTKESVVPLFSGAEKEIDPRMESIPERPAAQRPPPPINTAPHAPHINITHLRNAFGRRNTSFGLFPALFGLITEEPTTNISAREAQDATFLQKWTLIVGIGLLSFFVMS